MNKETKEAAFPLWEAVCYKEGHPPYKIVYSDDCLIVCKKAPGLAVQSASLRTKDLETMLKNKLAMEAKKDNTPQRAIGKEGKPTVKGTDNKNAPYLAVVHRLDQPVQGLVVFAKTPDAADFLSKQVQSREMKKEYMAVCEGVPVRPAGTLQDYLLKDGKTNSSVVVEKETKDAKEAILDYNLLEIAGDKSLLKIKLHTGRHHQIRVQLANAGFPIVGDQKYNKNAGVQKPTGPMSISKRTNQVLKLCACKLEFTHPKTNEKMVFSLYDNRAEYK